MLELHFSMEHPGYDMEVVRHYDDGWCMPATFSMNALCMLLPEQLNYWLSNPDYDVHIGCKDHMEEVMLNHFVDIGELKFV